MAERSIIETMAQKLHEDRRARDGFFIPWSECHPSHHKATREDVLSVMRSLLEAGPTEVMTNAAADALGIQDRETFAVEFAATFRAALEEADSHG